VQATQQAAQLDDRVRGGAGHRTAVHVAHRAEHLQVRVEPAAHAQAHRRVVLPPQHRVGEDDEVGVEPLPVLADQLEQVRRAGLLLALHEHLQVHRRRRAAGRRQMRADAPQVRHDLPLGVGGTAAVQVPVALGGLERRRLLPLLVLRRADVVVAVDEHGRRVRRRAPFGVDGRALLRFEHLHDREPDAAQGAGKPVRRAAKVDLMLRQATDGPEPDPAGQLVRHRLPVLVEEIVKALHRSLIYPPAGHGTIPVRRRSRALRRSVRCSATRARTPTDEGHRC
jgi:hypothetical protein